MARLIDSSPMPRRIPVRPEGWTRSAAALPFHALCDEPLARNDVEGSCTNLSPSLRGALATKQSSSFSLPWIASQELAMTLRGPRVNRVRWLPGLSTSCPGQKREARLRAISPGHPRLHGLTARKTSPTDEKNLLVIFFDKGRHGAVATAEGCNASISNRAKSPVLNVRIRRMPCTFIRATSRASCTFAPLTA
jgi:hypothetical protein